MKNLLAQSDSEISGYQVGDQPVVTMETKLCPQGSAHDNWGMYEYGEIFRPATYFFIIVGFFLLLIVIVFKKKISLENKAITLGVATVFLVGSGLMSYYLANTFEPKNGSVHEHANIAMVVKDIPMDFRSDKYQSFDGHVISDFVGFYDGNGDVVHKNASGITWGYFLWSLGLPIKMNCITQPDGEKLCNNQTDKWTTLVNGKVVDNLRNTEIHDLDRLFLYYGSEELATLKERSQSIPDTACMYSGKCPEKGLILNCSL